ncbi:MAG: hypothetical protein AAGI01_08345 [Myxococcota bacterium]
MDHAMPKASALLSLTLACALPACHEPPRTRAQTHGPTLACAQEHTEPIVARAGGFAHRLERVTASAGCVLTLKGFEAIDEVHVASGATVTLREVAELGTVRIEGEESSPAALTLEDIGVLTRRLFLQQHAAVLAKRIERMGSVGFRGPGNVLTAEDIARVRGPAFISPGSSLAATRSAFAAVTFLGGPGGSLSLEDTTAGALNLKMNRGTGPIALRRVELEELDVAEEQEKAPRRVTLEDARVAGDVRVRTRASVEGAGVHVGGIWTLEGETSARLSKSELQGEVVLDFKTALLLVDSTVGGAVAMHSDQVLVHKGTTFSVPLPEAKHLVALGPQDDVGAGFDAAVRARDLAALRGRLLSKATELVCRSAFDACVEAREEARGAMSMSFELTRTGDVLTGALTDVSEALGEVRPCIEDSVQRRSGGVQSKLRGYYEGAFAAAMTCTASVAKVGDALATTISPTFEWREELTRLPHPTATARTPRAASRARQASPRRP